MARAVRKVSRTNTKNQKKDIKISKKWLITIISTISVIVIGLIVGLTVYFTTRGDDTYVSDKIYFNEPVKTSDGVDVTFNKDNYQAISRYIEEGNYEHTFIFVYDGSAFYADEKDTDNYNAKYTELITRLANLQYAVDQAQASDISVELYVVDVNVDSGVNSGILTDSDYGALYSEESTTYEPAFIYINVDEYKEKVEYDGASYTISTKSWTDVFNSSIRYAINFINSLK